MLMGCNCGNTRSLGVGATPGESFINPNGLPENCNTAGGYSLQQPSCYLAPQCMKDDQFKVAQAACNNIPTLAAQQQQDTLNQELANAAPAVSNAVTSQPAWSQAPTPTATAGNGNDTVTAQHTLPVLLTNSSSSSSSSNSSSDFLSQYGLYLALAAGGLFLLSQSKG